MIPYTKNQNISGIDEYVLHNPHPPEIPAFQRDPLKFYVSEPAGGVNADTIPILAMPGHKVLAGMTPYLRSLHRSISKKMNALVVTVEFLGIKAIRGAQTQMRFDAWCLKQTNYNLRLRNLPEIPDEVFRTGEMSDIFSYLKTLPASENKVTAPLACLVRWDPGDHYDMGLVQVLDCLWAVKILKEQYPQANWSSLTAAGVSHGGYMASQCAKLAPNTFALAVNAYGWTEPYLPWLIKEQWGRTFERDGLHFIYFIDNYWSLDPASPYFLSPERRLIRSQNDADQLSQWRRQQQLDHRPHFVFTQQIDDKIHPRQDKKELIQKMQMLGFSMEYLDSLDEELKSKYRSLAQGDKVSFKGLIYDFVTPDRLPKNRDYVDDFDLRSVINYQCGKAEYRIDFSGEMPLLKVSQKISS